MALRPTTYTLLRSILLISFWCQIARIEREELGRRGVHYMKYNDTRGTAQIWPLSLSVIAARGYRCMSLSTPPLVLAYVCVCDWLLRGPIWHTGAAVKKTDREGGKLRLPPPSLPSRPKYTHSRSGIKSVYHLHSPPCVRGLSLSRTTHTHVHMSIQPQATVVLEKRGGEREHRIMGLFA